MATYVMLSRLTTEGMKRARSQPDSLSVIASAVELYEGKVVGDFHLFGEYDHCTIFEVPDNMAAVKTALQREVSESLETEILPAIDLPIFARLLEQTTETVGPHSWQIRFHAQVGRRLLRRYTYTRHITRACKPLTITGREHFKEMDGPCIIVGNHTSHMDSLVLFEALPRRVKWRVLFGAAADRWFLKDRKGMTKQGWWQSLALGTFPIKRGGGSTTLDYAKWLLDQGWNVCIFPEGTRSTSRHLGRFRHGVSILALEKGVPVVPIYLAGLREMRPKGTKETIPGPAAAHILPPIHFPESTTVPEATEMIFRAMNAMHRRVQEQGILAPAPSREELGREQAPAVAGGGS